jgi:hypothetical protein
MSDELSKARQGAIAVRGETKWNALQTPPTSVGKVLTSNGEADPSWVAPDDLTINDPAAVDAAASSGAVDDHFHNENVPFGVAAVPSDTHKADVDSLTGFSLTSGVGVFGSYVQILGTADTPFRTGRTIFDMRKINVLALSKTTPYVIRIVWTQPTGQTVVEAVAAFQYTEDYLQNFLGNCVFQETCNIRIAVGYPVYAAILCASAGTASLLFSRHEYPSDSL